MGMESVQKKYKSTYKYLQPIEIASMTLHITSAATVPMVLYRKKHACMTHCHFILKFDEIGITHPLDI